MLEADILCILGLCLQTPAIIPSPIVVLKHFNFVAIKKLILFSKIWSILVPPLFVIMLSRANIVAGLATALWQIKLKQNSIFSRNVC